MYKRIAKSTLPLAKHCNALWEKLAQKAAKILPFYKIIFHFWNIFLSTVYIVWNLDKVQKCRYDVRIPDAGYNIYHHYLVFNQFQHLKKERKKNSTFFIYFYKKNTLFPIALMYGGPCVWNWKNKLVNCISIELKTPSWSKLVTYIQCIIWNLFDIF